MQDRSAHDVPLAADFPTVTEDAWLAQVRAVLAKGKADATPEQLDAAFERQLVTRTVDGLRVEPLYVAPGGATIDAGLPGVAPYVRGTRALGARAHGWDVRQRVAVGADAAAAAAGALDELERGTTSLLLDLRATPTIDADVLDAALAGVDLDLITLALDAGPRWAEAAAALEALWATRGSDPARQQAVLGADPWGTWAEAGGSTDLDAAVADAARWAAKAAGAWPGVRTVVVDAARYHEAGGGDVEELALSVATGVTALRALTGAGLDVDAAAGQVEFRFAATPDQFLTIAKLRAARWLWQRATDVAGAGPAAQRQRQHAVTSTAAATRYDVWVNLLRSTVGCFAAAVGGADAITVLPHDQLVADGGSPLGRRLARNTQLVLMEESHLAKVVDMAGGSWYVEQLTRDLAEAAWAWFQELERAGGLPDALRAGLVQDRLAQVAAARATRLATRRQALTGLSEFPAVDDAVPPALAAPAEAPAGTPIVPVRAHRWSEAFEAQRARAERLAAAGTPAVVFLATLGTPADFTARLTFTQNLFAVAGIRSTTSEGADDPEALAKAFVASGARLACLCSSDKRYAAQAVEAARALAAAGPARLYLAGKPAGMDDALAAAGVDEQLVAGSDVLDVLTRALDVLEGA